jgi:hypothetical protein
MRKKVFESIDSALFTQIDRFKKTPEYNKFIENFNLLDESVQSFLKLSILLVVTLIPLSFFFVLYLGNLSLRKEILLKNQVISLSQQIASKSNLIENESRKILSRTNVDSQSAITQKLTQSTAAVGVELAKLQISNFESNELSGNIIQSQANIKFNALSNEQLFGLIQNLVSTDKMRIESLTVQKNSETQLLEGIFTAIYFSKMAESFE